MITPFIIFFSLQGLVESSVELSLIAGETITGTLQSTERYEDGYLAHVLTETHGAVTVKISATTQRTLKDGMKVQLVYNFDLIEVDGGIHD